MEISVDWIFLFFYIKHEKKWFFCILNYKNLVLNEPDGF